MVIINGKYLDGGPHPLTPEQRYAQVIIDIPVQEVDHPFEYIIPSALSTKVDIGSTVLVPFGPSLRVGYVIALTPERLFPRLSPIREVIEETPAFDREMVDLCRWVADYYLSTLGEALKLALPPGRGRRVSQHILLNGDIGKLLEKVPASARQRREVLRKMAELGGKASPGALRKIFGKRTSSLIGELEGEGFVSRKYCVSEPKVDIKHEQWIRLGVSPARAREVVSDLTTRAPKQQRILEILLEGEQMPVHELLSLADAPRASLSSLVTKSLVELFEYSTFREPDFYYPEVVRLPTSLTGEQEKAVGEVKDVLDKGISATLLLQGVTGSGKTEVYLQAIAHALSKGKTAIVLVPEIALTPQTVHRFRARFGEIVAVLHSGLGMGERFDQWRRIKEGDFKVVVGARSALFAPLRNLGLIIVDEEHETTYKQNRNPRYHAREVALKRAQLSGACVILGSATPAVESKFCAERGQFKLARLTRRIEDRPLPDIEIVDMRDEMKNGNRGIFSLRLREAMEECIRSRGKMILFLNRRGFSSFILCRECGLVLKCKKCAVSLTYHADKRVLKCHHCNYVAPAPEICPRCGGYRIGYFGVGTQKVENELKRFFPELAVIRMDADTTTRRESHRRRLMEFQSREVSVLLGTQMIAKGLDFPEVTLVGAINADTALNLPDFRAGERTFQLLMQVSGRAGRGKRPGRVIVQTYLPESYAIQALTQGDYDHFYSQELPLREELLYPPFCHLVNILISGRDEARTEKAASEAGKFLTSVKLDGLVGMLGPAPAPLPKIKNKFRWHIILKVGDPAVVKGFLRENFRRLLPEDCAEDVNISIDVDPVWML